MGAVPISFWVHVFEIMFYCGKNSPCLPLAALGWGGPGEAPSSSSQSLDELAGIHMSFSILARWIFKN